ncbi:MAG: ATP-binding protein [Chitinophagales bacterium]
MKLITLVITYCIIWSGLFAQDISAKESRIRKIEQDSLMALINLEKGDINEVQALMKMAFLQDSPDSGIMYGQRGIALARSLNYAKGEADCLYSCCFRFEDLGNIIQCTYYSLKALEIFESIRDFRGISETKLLLQAYYREVGDNDNALAYAFSGEQLAESYSLVSEYDYPGHRLAPLFLAEMGQTYLDKGQIDSSLFFTKKAIDQNELFYGTVWNFPLYLLGRIQTIQGNYQAALQNFREALLLAVSNHFARDTLQVFSGLSNLYLREGKFDSAIYYSKKVVINRNGGETPYVLESINDLSRAYKMRDEKDSAIKYIEFRGFYADSLSNSKKLRDIQNLAFNLKLKQQELISSQEQYKEKLRFYSLAGGLLVIMLIAVFLWRNIRQRQKAYVLLEKQKEETDQQKIKTEKALSELKVTQFQLIQSEKMASLGELTAGIAHEMQNPLNFVNNFSDINKELIGELEDEMKKGNMQKARAIAQDIRDNEEKINHHGQRADAIVKNMLQHSRIHSGQKEATDVNKLAEESFQLSYQGFRSKNKSFKVSLKKDLDQSIGKINIIPQDISRVLMNLFNNAFYSISERERIQLNGYEPFVSVVTKRIADKIEITVSDNGMGIPQKILDKIYQPFFTTKPAGQGTGLGLSMSYDIIKAQGGDISVRSIEHDGAEFTVELPIA